MAIKQTKLVTTNTSTFDIADSYRQQSVVNNIKGTAKESLVIAQLLLRTTSDLLCFVSDAVRNDSVEVVK